MEKRAHPRTSVNHSAVFSGPNLPTLPCQVRDFSVGGLFIQLDQPAISELLANLNGRDPSGIPCATQLTIGSKKSKKVNLNIAHICASGVGVAFQQPDNEGVLVEYLTEYAAKPAQTSGQTNAPKPKQSFSPEKSAQGVEKAHHLTEQFVFEHFEKLINSGANELMLASDNARTNDDRTDLQFASSRLINDQSRLKSLLKENMAVGFSDLRSGQGKSPSKEEEELGLVDPDEFDEWLAIIGIARKYDEKYLPLVKHLEFSLGELLHRQIKNEDSPFSPYSLLWMFKESLTALGFGTIVQKVLFQAFHKSVLTHLHALYAQLSQLFEKFGFSEKESSKRIIRSQSRSRSHHHATVSEEIEQLARVHGKADIVGALAALSPHSSLSPVQRMTGYTQPDVDSDLPHIIPDQQTIIEFLDLITQKTGKSITDQLKELLANQVNTSSDEIAFDSLTTSSIETTESLVGSIQQDNLLNSELKGFVNNLELPLVKEALLNPTLLNDPTHPGRKLLEVVGQLAPYVSAIENERNQPLLNSLEQISSLIKRKGSSLMLPDVEKRLETLLKLQNSQFDNNVSIVLNSAQLEDTRHRAQSFVLGFLEQLTESPIPQSSKELLRLGWAGLLTSVAATKSKQSREWREYSGVFELMEQAFPVEATCSPFSEEQRRSLLTILDEGFQAYPVFRRQANDYLDRVRELLQPGSEGFVDFTHERVSITKEELIEYLPDYQPEQAGAPLSINEELEPWIEKARNLKIDEWIVENQTDAPPRFLRLSWKATNSLRFVLVDGNGRKVADHPLSEFAEQLKEQTYTILNGGELPMVDRAVHRLLQQTYEKFKNDSDKDELTGLSSRKALQRMLEEALSRSRHEGAEHVLIAVNIDGFSVVNDLHGIEGGDELLNSIGKLLSTYSPSSAEIARLGNDEYGVLVRDCSIQRGYEIAERQRSAIESFKFCWGETELNITASVGIVPIDVESLSVTDLISASSAACNMARQEGRNCSRIYQPSDEAYTSRQKLIRSIPAIEKALESDSLKLFSQLISPIDADADTPLHYEVLLRVYDEDNELVSPVHFIQAAEQYDRMRYVDRWVIKHFFDWMNANHTQLPQHDTFSINLSALTLAERDFGKFIDQKLSECTFPLERIAFEITETAFVGNMEQVKQIVSDIRGHGCEFFLDDFGSGYASYSYLKEFPIDAIKIDGVFVRDMLTEKSSYAMVKSITEVAHFMDKKVIAEYVSSEDILEALRDIGVDYAQGFALGKPMDLDQLIAPDSIPESA